MVLNPQRPVLFSGWAIQDLRGVVPWDNVFVQCLRGEFGCRRLPSCPTCPLKTTSVIIDHLLWNLAALLDTRGREEVSLQRRRFDWWKQTAIAREWRRVLFLCNNSPSGNWKAVFASNRNSVNIIFRGLYWPSYWLTGSNKWPCQRSGRRLCCLRDLLALGVWSQLISIADEDWFCLGTKLKLTRNGGLFIRWCTKNKTGIVTSSFVTYKGQPYYIGSHELRYSNKFQRPNEDSHGVTTRLLTSTFGWKISPGC